MTRRLVIRVAVAFALIALLAALTLVTRYRSFLNTPLVLPDQGIELVIEPGTSYLAMVRQLNQLGISSTIWPWRLMQKLEPRLIRAGEYRLATGLLPAQWLEKLAAGNVIVHHFTIIEGWTFSQLRAALVAEPLLAVTTAGLEEAVVMSLLGHVEQNPEGRFLPETYQFTRGDNELDLLKRAWTAMDRALDEAWQNRRDSLRLNRRWRFITLITYCF